MVRSFPRFFQPSLAVPLACPCRVGSPADPVWVALSGSPGYRHWFFPTLAFCLGLLSGIVPHCFVKVVVCRLLCVMFLGSSATGGILPFKNPFCRVGKAFRGCTRRSHLSSLRSSPRAGHDLGQARWTPLSGGKITPKRKWNRQLMPP